MTPNRRAGRRAAGLRDYLMLYALIGTTVYLLAIKHHRQLSFDLGAHWLSP